MYTFFALSELDKIIEIFRWPMTSGVRIEKLDILISRIIMFFRSFLKEICLSRNIINISRISIFFWFFKLDKKIENFQWPCTLLHDWGISNEFKKNPYLVVIAFLDRPIVGATDQHNWTRHVILHCRLLEILGYLKAI